MSWPFTRRHPRIADLRTQRLRLVASTPAMLAAHAAGDGSLPKLLRARIPADWPPVHWAPHVLAAITQQFVDAPETLGWHRFVILQEPMAKERTLVGVVGGFPRPGGDVEIAYSTLPEFQRRGHGTEAVTALVDHLLTRDGVASVSAQTTAATPESMKIMERCGMSFAGPGDEDGTIRYRRLR